MKYRNILGLAACFGILACTPSTNVPGTELFLEAPDGDYHGPMETLRLEASLSTVEVAETTLVTVYGIFEDGTEIDVSAKITAPDLYFAMVDESVAKLGDLDGGRINVIGTGVGMAKVTAQVGKVVGKLDIEIVPASLRTLEIAGTDSVGRGAAGQLVVTGTYGDLSTADLTADVVYTSSDESILTVTDSGTIVGIGLGSATVTAAVGEITASFDVTVVCVYPQDAPSLVRVGQTFPNMSWSNAVFPNNVQGPFDMKQVYCQEGDFEGVKSLFFQISAEWCGPCKSYRREFNANRGVFDNNRSLFIVTELVDTQNIANVTSEHANNSIRREVGEDWGVSLGDLDTLPQSNLFNSSNLVAEWPTFMVVSTRDMRVTATSRGDLGTFLNKMDQILANPNWDWSDLDNPVESFVSNCGPGQDEAMEPNDTIAQAKEIGTGAVMGGICTDAPDYYRVDVQGDWTATIATEATIGDLDIYLWDESTNAAKMNGNFPIGSYTTENIERFESSGPGLIRIEGKTGASAPYTLIIRAK